MALFKLLCGQGLSFSLFCGGFCPVLARSRVVRGRVSCLMAPRSRACGMILRAGRFRMCRRFLVRRLGLGLSHARTSNHRRQEQASQPYRQPCLPPHTPYTENVRAFQIRRLLVLLYDGIGRGLQQLSNRGWRLFPFSILLRWSGSQMVYIWNRARPLELPTPLKYLASPLCSR